MRVRGIAAILAIAMLTALQAKGQSGQAAVPSPYPVVQGKTYKFEKVGEINTHFHYDHTDGNQIFSPDVQIIAHEYVRTAILTFNILESEPFKTYQVGRVTQIDSLQKQIADEKDLGRKADLQKQLADAQLLLEQLREVKPTPPNVTYSSKMVLQKGQREIQIFFLGAATPGAKRSCIYRKSGSFAPAT